MPNNRSRGQRAELEIVALLESVGIRANRGNQSSFRSTEADVLCPDFDTLKYRIEVKIAQEFQLDSPKVRNDWATKLEQDIAKFCRLFNHDPADWTGVIFHRQNRRDWFVYIPKQNRFLLATDFLKEVNHDLGRQL